MKKDRPVGPMALKEKINHNFFQIVNSNPNPEYEIPPFKNRNLLILEVKFVA